MERYANKPFGRLKGFDLENKVPRERESCEEPDIVNFDQTTK